MVKVVPEPIKGIGNGQKMAIDSSMEIVDYTLKIPLSVILYGMFGLVGLLVSLGVVIYQNLVK